MGLAISRSFCRAGARSLLVSQGQYDSPARFAGQAQSPCSSCRADTRSLLILQGRRTGMRSWPPHAGPYAQNAGGCRAERANPAHPAGPLYGSAQDAGLWHVSRAFPLRNELWKRNFPVGVQEPCILCRRAERDRAMARKARRERVQGETASLSEGGEMARGPGRGGRASPSRRRRRGARCEASSGVNLSPTNSKRSHSRFARL